MISNLFGQTAQVYRPTKANDGFGDPVDSWPSAPNATYPCRLQQVMLTRTGEDVDRRDVSMGRWEIYLPGEAVLTEHDRIVVDGRTFEVFGVYPVSHPRTGIHHVQASLRTYSGTVPSG